jgi:hypothetical protein
MLFGWFIGIYFFFSYRSIFLFTPTFSGTQLGHNKEVLVYLDFLLLAAVTELDCEVSYVDIS